MSTEINQQKRIRSVTGKGLDNVQKIRLAGSKTMQEDEKPPWVRMPDEPPSNRNLVSGG